MRAVRSEYSSFENRPRLERNKCTQEDHGNDADVREPCAALAGSDVGRVPHQYYISTLLDVCTYIMYLCVYMRYMVRFVHSYRDLILPIVLFSLILWAD